MWWLIGSAIASVLSSIVGGIFNYKSAKSSQESAYQLAQNQLDAQIEANNLNRNFYEQNLERNSVKSQMQQYLDAGVNPNLANTNFVSMPAYQTQATSGQPVYNRALQQSVMSQMFNQIKSSFYDMLIKKEQYLQMRQNREYLSSRNQLVHEQISKLHDEWVANSVRSNLDREFMFSLIDKDGNYNSAFYDLLDSYAKNYNNKLLESGYRNANLISNNDVLDARAALTNEQVKKIGEEIKRLQQLVKRGEFTDGDLMRVLEVIKTIFNIF